MSAVHDNSGVSNAPGASAIPQQHGSNSDALGGVVTGQDRLKFSKFLFCFIA
jgi:hypothetical protein